MKCFRVLSSPAISNIYDIGYNHIWISVEWNFIEASGNPPWSHSVFFGAVAFENRIWILVDWVTELWMKDVWASDDGTNWETVASGAPGTLSSTHAASFMLIGYTPSEE